MRSAQWIGASRRGAAGEPSDTTERALAHLAPRHATALRSHMAFYRSCLEATCLLPADELVQAAVQIEWFWYTTPFKKFYRDHLAHVMKVATTALFLMQDTEGPLAEPVRPLIDRVALGLAHRTLGSPAIRAAARRLGNDESSLGTAEFWRAAVLESCRLAGLLHDMAYPAQMATTIGEATEVANAFASFQPGLDDTRLRAIQFVQSTLLGAPFGNAALFGSKPTGIGAEVFERILARSHSLQAGVSLLDFRARCDGAWRLSAFEAFVIEWAALAASMHDYDKVFECRQGGPKCREEPLLESWLADLSNLAAIRPTFQSDPVSYIVALADQLQDFGRLNYETDPNAPLDASVFNARFPWQAVVFERLNDFEATVTFELGPDNASPFGVPGDRRKAALDRKLRDAKAIFETDGWLDHSGLFRTVTVGVIG